MSTRLSAMQPRHKQGWRTIGGIRKFYRSSWEANYARYLQWLKERGEIVEWEHEPETFWFLHIKRGVRSYLPDFRITERSGATIYHEVKGYMDRASKTKLARMARCYPEVRIIVIDQRQYRSITNVVARMVEGWE